MKKECSKKYTSTCICSCSSLFKNWQERHTLSILPRFDHCAGVVYEDPMVFHTHLHSMQHEYYHRIVMRQVQNLYSSLIAKFKISDQNTNNSHKSTSSTLQSAPKGKISLPMFVLSQSSYDTIIVTRKAYYVVLTFLKNLCFIFELTINLIAFNTGLTSPSYYAGQTY